MKKLKSISKSFSNFYFNLNYRNQRRNVILRNETENESFIFIGNSLQFDSSFTEKSTLILGGLIVLIVSNSIIVNFCFHRFALNASSNIHNSMFLQLMKTSLRFFEINPSGKYSFTIFITNFSFDAQISYHYFSFVQIEF